MKAVGRPTKTPGGQVTTDASRGPTSDNDRRERRNRGENSETHLLLRVGEAARLLGIGTTLACKFIGQGRLPHVRLGRALHVPRAGGLLKDGWEPLEEQMYRAALDTWPGALVEWVDA
jgi:excisionase family DNA binding protein